MNTTPCPCCGNYKTRGITVDAIITKDDKILFIKRKNNPYKNLWALPGGHVDFDETVEEAISREVKEETGLIATSVKLFGIYSDPKRHPKQFVAASFIMTVRGIPKASDDASDIKYFNPNNLPTKLAFDHQKIVADYLKRII